MKKVLSILLCAAMLTVFAGCTAEEPEATQAPSATTEATAPAESETPAESPEAAA